ncbi:MAG: aspartate kinase [Flavobacteriaceae bacterium]|nr:aspartate kinase [Flavobacteriaceae bacterium]
MRVFKFGGASVKDCMSIRNCGRILNQQGHKNVVLVVSAMGKMTNAFEKLINSYINKKDYLQESLQHILDFHNNIILNLFEDKPQGLITEVESYYSEIKIFISSNTSEDYSFVYDQLIGYGELLSTTIISYHLKEVGIENEFIDIRKYIVTDSNYRDAKVDWQQTNERLNTISKGKLMVTQGFLAADITGNTTSLGREGSDYTAAIIAHSFSAESVTIWKDVDGVLNADPRYFENTSLLKNISYREAIEMSFYGASVIHPKTLKPLENKNIPLYVRSFISCKKEGTKVGNSENTKINVPVYILKKGQTLLSVCAKDFSFIIEKHISHIYSVLGNYKIKVNLTQNSALSFSLCIEDIYCNMDKCLEELEKDYKLRINKKVSLYTVRHFTDESVSELEKDKNILLKQQSIDTVQLVVV